VSGITDRSVSNSGFSCLLYVELDWINQRDCESMRLEWQSMNSGSTADIHD